MQYISALIDTIKKIDCTTPMNDSEVSLLNDWINKYKATLLEANKPSNNIFQILENIISTRRICESVKNELIIYLDDLIKDNKRSNKLLRIRNKIQNQEIIGNELIEIVDDIEFVKQIHQKSQSQLKNALSSYTKSSVNDKEIIIISLSLIALNSYDGSYYDGVRGEYKDLYSLYSEQKIEGLIRDILNMYRFPEEKTSRDRIINVALRNAIVPKHYLAGFFDFIYDIYKVNFSYDLPSDLFEEFEFIYEGLKSYMSSDSDDFTTNVTQKTYKLIKTTKDLVQKGNIKELIDLSISVAKIIDMVTWQRNYNMPNKYFDSGFNEWINWSSKKNGELDRLEKKKTIYARWEPRFVLKDGDVYLVPPIHRVKDSCNPWDIYILIKNQNGIIKRISNPKIQQIFGGYQFTIDMAKIENPLSNISYCVYDGNKKIYDSERKLHRESLVFNSDGEELKNNHDYDGEIVICTKNQFENRVPYFKCDNYMLTSKTVKVGDSILLGNEVFSFSIATKSGIYGERRTNHLIVSNKGIEYPVYKSVMYLVFEDDTKNGAIEILINDEQHKINDYWVVINETDNKIRYSVDMNLLKAGIYDISINRINKGNAKELLSTSFALDKGLDTNLLTIDNGRCIASINSSLFDTPLHIEFDIKTIDIQGIQFNNNSNSYRYMLPLGLEVYRLSNGYWKSIKEDFCVDEIQRESIMEIYGVDIDSIMYMASDGTIIDPNVPLYDKCSYKKCYIGKIVEYKKIYKYVDSILMREGKAVGMIRCYFECMITRRGLNVDFNPVTSKLAIQTEYLGRGPIYYKLFDSERNLVFTSGEKKSKELMALNGIRSFEKYTLQVCWDDINNATHTLSQTEHVFYSRKDIVGHDFKLVDGCINERKGDKFINRRVSLKDCYAKITQMVDDGTYIGYLYTKTPKRKFNLRNINPVQIELCTDDIDGSFDVYITNSGDGLLYDRRYSNIMNSLDDSKAPDIFLFTMNAMPVD